MGLGYFSLPHPVTVIALFCLLSKEQISYRMRNSNPTATFIPSAEALRSVVCWGGGIFRLFLVSGAVVCTQHFLVFSFLFLLCFQKDICSRGNYDQIPWLA